MTYTEAKRDVRYINGINVNGNLKLRNDEKTRFIIWNLPAQKTCPFATEHCKQACYAMKAERQYKGARESRQHNYEISLQDDFTERMIFTIETELNSKKFNGKKCVFRIHESGDFYNLEYTEKWVNIAQYFANDDRIVFLAYTKSIIYLINCGYSTEVFPNNFVIRSSIWDDTRKDLCQLSEIYNFPIYTALTQEEMTRERKNGHKFFQCHCENCATCGACWKAQVKDIIVKIH